MNLNLSIAVIAALLHLCSALGVEPDLLASILDVATAVLAAATVGRFGPD